MFDGFLLVEHFQQVGDFDSVFQELTEFEFGFLVNRLEIFEEALEISENKEKVV